MANNHFSFFLARRFFFQQFGQKGKGRRSSAPAIGVATMGLAIGMAVMICSLCVVKGFKGEMYDKLRGLTADLVVMTDSAMMLPDGAPLRADAQQLSLMNQAATGETVHCTSVKNGLIKTAGSFTGVMLKGVDSGYNEAFLRRSLVAGRLPAWRTDSASGQVFISQTQADKLHLKVGDNVYCYFFAETIKQRRLEVAGIYVTHIKQLDDIVALTDRYTVNRLNGWQPNDCAAVEIHLPSGADRKLKAAELTQQLNAQRRTAGLDSVQVMTMDRNPQTAPITAWVDVLDLNLQVILIIMVCVAGFSMISGLLILILERTRTIGVLKALGMPNRRVRSVFLWFAALIVGRGLLLGNVIGLALVLGQRYFKWIHLNPAAYHVDTVPIVLDWTWLMVLNVGALAVTMLALLLPSLLVTSIQPAKSIRFD